jgi:hypothetical protein
MPNPNAKVLGRINGDASLVDQVITDAEAIPVNPSPGADPDIGIKTMEPHELEGCDPTGAQVFCVVMRGDTYTKP